MYTTSKRQAMKDNVAAQSELRPSEIQMKSKRKETVLDHRLDNV